MDSNCINRSVSFMVDTNGMWTQLNRCFKMSCLIQRHFKVFALNWVWIAKLLKKLNGTVHYLDIRSHKCHTVSTGTNARPGAGAEPSAWMTYSKNRKWSKAEELLLILISYLSPFINCTLARSHNLHVVDRIDKSSVLCHQFIDQCSATNPSTKYYLNKTDNGQTLWLNKGIMTHQLQ